ncbi:MAG: hypothetical protein K9J30_02890 [Bacteroidales bacterium]|nr:hypothetical protein [Bacteroidales bacterium]
MKKIFIISILILFLASFTSCEEQFRTEVPELISFTYEPLPAIAGTTTTFTIEAKAEHAVIWYGESDSDYDQHLVDPDPENTGAVLNLEYDDDLEYYTATRNRRYAEPGSYSVYLILSNIGELGDVVEQVVEKLEVEVQAPPAE